VIWRDDDILKTPNSLDALLEVDDLCQRYLQPHTVAVIVETLTPALATVLRGRGMDVQLHCWRHHDLSVDAAGRAQLGDAVQKIADLVGTRPTILYPPWNRTSPALEAAAAALGLTVSCNKLSLAQFIRVEGDVRERVVNFHYWHPPDRELLKTALQIEVRRVKRPKGRS
jgi:peptidoglycan/xylan/chitin deacetylase (PgdA/CDA1 family)